MPKPRDAVIDIILKEYDKVAEFYHNAIQERFKLFDWYIKIIPIPTTVILALLTFVEKSQVNLQVIDLYNVAGYLFLLLFTCGICLYVVYIKQGNNTDKYSVAMKYLRNSLRELHPMLERSLVMDHLGMRKPRDKPEPAWYEIFNTVKFWRGMIFVLFNSFAMAMAVYCIKEHYWQKKAGSEVLAAFIFFITFLFHLGVYKIVCRPLKSFKYEPDK